MRVRSQIIQRKPALCLTRPGQTALPRYPVRQIEHPVSKVLS